MKPRITLLLLTILLLAACTTMSIVTKFKRGEPVFPRKAAVIEFKLQGHKIMVPVGINDAESEYSFLLDTGAMSAIALDLADSLGLGPGLRLPTPVDSVEIYLTKEPLSVYLGGAAVEGVFLARLDFDTIFRIGGIDGFLGSNLLRHFCVALDYDREELILSRDYPEWVSKEPHYRLDLETKFPLYFPLVNCTLNNSLTTQAMIDTGAPDLLVLPLSLFEEVVLASGAEYIGAAGVVAKWPFTTSDECYLARLPSCRLGELSLTDLPVLVAELPSTADHLLLGKGFLDRFQLLLNYPRSELLLMTSIEPQFPDNIISTGLKVERREGRTLVRGYWLGSPADRCEIKVGDELVSIAGQETVALTMDEIRELLDDERSAVADLVIRRDGVNQRLELPREPLLP